MIAYQEFAATKDCADGSAILPIYPVAHALFQVTGLESRRGQLSGRLRRQNPLPITANQIFRVKNIIRVGHVWVVGGQRLAFKSRERVVAVNHVRLILLRERRQFLKCSRCIEVVAVEEANVLSLRRFNACVARQARHSRVLLELNNGKAYPPPVRRIFL